MEKPVPTGWRVVPSLIDKVKAKAETERRSITQQLAIILEEYFEHEEKKK